MADELRWAASQLQSGFVPGSSAPGFHPPPVLRRQPAMRTRRYARAPARRGPFAGGGLIFLLLALFVLFRAPGMLFMLLPVLLFFVLPFFFIRAMSRRMVVEPDPSYDEGEIRAQQDEDLAQLPPETDAREVRLQRTCDRILTALERSPESVRSFLTRPNETIETLRRTGLDLLGRERDLRALASEVDDSQLQQERLQLAARVARESDPVARQRLQAALAALDDQLGQREAILRSANRLDAELTRLIYTLEGLYTQILRVRSADTTHEAGASEALRQSIESLRGEMGALADALEDMGQAAPPEVLAGRPRSGTPLHS